MALQPWISLLGIVVASFSSVGVKSTGLNQRVENFQPEMSNGVLRENQTNGYSRTQREGKASNENTADGPMQRRINAFEVYPDFIALEDVGGMAKMKERDGKADTQFNKTQGYSLSATNLTLIGARAISILFKRSVERNKSIPVKTSLSKTTLYQPPSPSLSSVTLSSPPTFRLVLLLPKSSAYEFNSTIISVAVETALEHLNTTGKASGFRLHLDFGDSQCSEILGPIRAFEFFWQGLVDAFLGPFCDYSAAPVARYSAYWQVPVITAGALSHDFEKFKHTEYRTLTRVGASTVGVAALLTTAIKRHGWRKLVNIYDARAVINTIPKLCYLTSSAIVATAKGRQLEPTPVFLNLDEPGKMLKAEVGTEKAGK
ncbi:atrial natriuretic peptide receptor 1-like [Elysia marginata]|uniref:Atrial natriuretic peptide receptor 1-like n=1 Tax=Elysia marginata TaxID=1093978 RepID=A0AAV4HNC7_9GAST|nr:atrial natriuretic peptide receptor 1-like [Elysia marginata]